MANKIAFINAVKGQAVKDMNAYGVLSSLTIAQAILESGWGESRLSVEANNLFGVKATPNWHGETVVMNTVEYVDGVRVVTPQCFRKYPSWVESIADHMEVLRQSRYSNLINETDYKIACRKVQEDGYATDPHYADLLITIIEENRLHENDLKFKVERLMVEMNIKELQRWLNANGFTDEQGNKLDVDGIEGRHTLSAKQKAKDILGYILK